MRENIIEANVVLANCNWAFSITEIGASNEGYGSVMISGKVDVDSEYPGCPYCGGFGWVSCGKCGKLTCWTDEESYFTCTWCGSSGEVTKAENFDLQGGGY